MKIKEIFDRPKIISVVADVNEGKSMLLYHLLETLDREHKFNLFSYGLRINFKNSIQIFSVPELEGIENSIIVVDELSSLFDLDNRKIKKQIENSLRLINHNNNILVLCGVPENFKKFISGKIDVFIYKKTTIADLINGCKVKNVLMSYSGNERGSELLNMPIDKALIFNGEHYGILNIPYYKKYDTKKKNPNILQKKKKKVKK